VQTSSQAGLTRLVSTAIKVVDDPPIYMSDSPGVMMPFIPTPETFLALALCGSIRDKIVPPQILADFLLFHLNRKDPALYTSVYNIRSTNDIEEFLTGVASKTGKLMQGGYVDDRAAAMEAISRFRRGGLGMWHVDSITPDAFHRRIKEEIVARQRESRGSGNVVESRKPSSTISPYII
jgi:mitochondrial GTPase 1